MMYITHLVMKFLPIGVFGLVAKVVATTGLDAIKSVMIFATTIIGALAIYALLALPSLLSAVGRVNPIAHFKAMAPALVTAFSTSSTAVTLPITMECVEKRAFVSNRVCSFVIPLASSLNLSGTALYICSSVIFIAQAYGLDLSFATLFVIVLMTFFTSMGMAGIPSAGLISIVLILHTIGLPAEGIGLILAVERLLDMCRTTVSVFGNSCCAVLVAKSEGEKDVLRTLPSFARDA
jgi:proton glutamate symport protein